MRKYAVSAVAVLLVLFFSLQFAPSSQGAVIRVSPIGSDSNDGTTWDLAKKTIKAGIASAVAGDDVWVAAGSYQEHIVLKPGVALYGGFAGTETQVDERNWKANRTSIDAPQSQPADPVNGVAIPLPAVTIPYSSTVSGTRIDGFIITNLDSPNSGGGILCSGSAVIANNIITGCQANNGGGIYCGGNCSRTISGNVIKGNTANYSGGGIFCRAGTVEIKNNAICGNTAYGYASSALSVGGGGIYCSATAVIANNTITGNEVSAAGGGLLLSGGIVTVASNVIAANVVLDSTAGAGYGGGVCCYGSGTLNISNNTIVYNTSPLSGGGVYCAALSSAIENNILAYNSTGVGAGDCTPVLSHNCFYKQVGEVYDNVSPGDGDISTDPMFADAGCGNFRLKSSSQCVDGGSDVVVPDVPDMDGRPRVNGSLVDIGAYESDGSPLPANRVVFVNANAPAGGDGTTWERAYQTIQTAADDAAKDLGAEIRVARGEYRENVNLASFGALYGGFAGNEPTRDRDWKHNRTVIEGGENYVPAVENAGGMTIEGFTLKNGLHTRDGHSYISNNVIFAYGRGIDVFYADATITDNKISSPDSYGITLYQAQCIIARNMIFGCDMGISGTYSGTVATNVVAECRTGIDCAGGPVVITNNTIADCSVTGIDIYSAIAAVKNNIIAYCQTGITGSLTPDLPPVISNNGLFGNSHDYSGVEPGSGNVSGEPLFVSREYGDFRMQPDSSLRGKGDATAEGVGETDIDGNPRVTDGKVDIGAYQSDGSVYQPSHRTIYVNSAVEQSGNGSSWLLAYKTLSEAMDDIVANGSAEVWVAAGKYSGNVWAAPFSYLYGGFAGTESNREERNPKSNITTIEGSGIDFNDPPYSRGTVTCSGRGSIDGFTITNGWVGVMAMAGSMTVRNNTITGNEFGIVSSNGTVNIASNVVKANTSTGITLIGFSDTAYATNEVSGNIVTQNGRSGIVCGAYNTKIDNNIIANNVEAGVVCHRTKSFLINNTIAGNKSGVYAHDAANAFLTNNIIAFNAKSGVEAEVFTSQMPPWLSSSIATSYNDVYGNGTDFLNVNRCATDISVDPMLVDRANGDYHLKLGSPCVNAGSNSIDGFSHVDIDGENRIFGGAADIGADENQDAPLSILAAKKAANGTSINGKGMAVTAVFPGCFYIESDNRSSGIRVESAEFAFAAGVRVDLEGKVGLTADGEKYIDATSVSPAGAANISPLFMSNYSTGGGAFGLQQAVWGWRWVKIPGDGCEKRWMAADGLNNIGLLVKVCGRISYIDPDGGYFYINDSSVLSDGSNLGSEVPGIRVAGDGRSHQLGDMLTLTGISSCFKGEDGKLRRLLRPVE